MKSVSLDKLGHSTLKNCEMSEIYLKEGLNVPILTLIKFHLKTVCDIAKTKPPKNKALQSIKR